MNENIDLPLITQTPTATIFNIDLFSLTLFNSSKYHTTLHIGLLSATKRGFMEEHNYE